MSRIFAGSAVASFALLLLFAGSSKHFERSSTEVVDQTYPIDPTLA